MIVLWRVHLQGVYFPPLKMSNEKDPGWLGYIGDEILPNYISGL